MRTPAYIDIYTVGRNHADQIATVPYPRIAPVVTYQIWVQTPSNQWQALAGVYASHDKAESAARWFGYAVIDKGSTKAMGNHRAREPFGPRDRTAWLDDANIDKLKR